MIAMLSIHLVKWKIILIVADVPSAVFGYTEQSKIKRFCTWYIYQPKSYRSSHCALHSVLRNNSDVYQDCAIEN
jgi:hypothetical protein